MKGIGRKVEGGRGDFLHRETLDVELDGGTTLQNVQRTSEGGREGRADGRYEGIGTGN